MLEMVKSGRRHFIMSDAISCSSEEAENVVVMCSYSRPLKIGILVALVSILFGRPGTQADVRRRVTRKRLIRMHT
jgi:hypothetical protein